MCTCGCAGSGMLCMKRLKRVSESTDPWVTLFGEAPLSGEVLCVVAFLR